MKKLLSENEAVEFLEDRGVIVSVHQLRRYRQQKIGPKFLKNVISGRVGYPVDKLCEFGTCVWQPPEKEL